MATNRSSRLVAIAAVVVLCCALPGPAIAAPDPVPCVPEPGCWHPASTETFMWQLDGVVVSGRAATVYDVDAVDTPVATVRSLQKLGRKVVCYVSAGSWEATRPDAARFPARIRGLPLEGWPDERWLDIRRRGVLEPIMRSRIAACRAKGFDGIEFDNVDGYRNPTGFALTAVQQRSFNRWLADEAHRQGLAAFLKNDPDHVDVLVRWFDGAVVEQCFRFDECDAYAPFVRAGKPVFVAEYDLPLHQFCRAARALGMHAARYPLALDGRRWACP